MSVPLAAGRGWAGGHQGGFLEDMCGSEGEPASGAGGALFVALCRKVWGVHRKVSLVG